MAEKQNGKLKSAIDKAAQEIKAGNQDLTNRVRTVGLNLKAEAAEEALFPNAASTRG